MEIESDWTASALFSPSKARFQQAQAKDWGFVDAWLARRYGSKRLPTFERNEETLQILLSFATLNEGADEQRAAVERVEKAALLALSKPSPSVASGMHRTLLEHMDAGAVQDVNVMAEAAVCLNLRPTAATRLAKAIIELSNDQFDATTTLANVQAQRNLLHQEQCRLTGLLNDLEDDAFKSSGDLSKKTADWTTGSKHLKAKIGEYDERLSALRTVAHSPTIESVAHQKTDLTAASERLEILHIELNAFQSLPTERRKAQAMLEGAKDDLRQLIRRRNCLFENLVKPA